MILEADRPAIDALPKSLRTLLLSADYTAEGLNTRINRHEAGHRCSWLPGVAYSTGPKEYCPVYDVMINAWSPLAGFAACLRYFLIGGPVPAAYDGDLAPLCTWCEDRPAVEAHPNEAITERVCGQCYESLAQDFEEKRVFAEMERREALEDARVDHAIDEWKERRAERGSDR
jgi:hypothetical protein